MLQPMKSWRSVVQSVAWLVPHWRGHKQQTTTTTSNYKKKERKKEIHEENLTQRKSNTNKEKMKHTDSNSMQTANN